MTTTPLPLRIATAAAGIALAAILVRQCRKPFGWPGRFILWTMNLNHARVTRWGLSHVEVGKAFTILDVGCGGGRTVHTLATLAPEGKVHGIDYSAASVAASRRTNRDGIQAGRVDVRQASVSQLPFPEGTFDLVTAVETHYYWPDPASDVREVLRVIRPGGRFLLIAETYRGERFGTLFAPAMKLVGGRHLTIDEHRDLLAAAGFADVAVDVEKRHGWICAVGRKPAA